MLFKDKEYRFCANCSRAIEFDGDTMLCIKKGLVSKERICRAFHYDPLKRVPVKPAPIDFSDFRDVDFSLSSESNPAE